VKIRVAFFLKNKYFCIPNTWKILMQLDELKRLVAQGESECLEFKKTTGSSFVKRVLFSAMALASLG